MKLKSAMKYVLSGALLGLGLKFYGDAIEWDSYENGFLDAQACMKQKAQEELDNGSMYVQYMKDGNIKEEGNPLK